MADPREITTTLVVNFGSDAGARNDGLLAEVDGRPDGLNGGRTSFAPGDEVYILLYKTSNVTLNLGSPISSHGTITLRPSLSPQFVDKEADLQFVDEVESGLRYPLLDSQAPSGFWIGNNLGSVTKRGELTMGIPSQEPAEHWVGIYRQSWIAEADVYHLTNTYLPYDEYPIIIQWTGVAT